MNNYVNVNSKNQGFKTLVLILSFKTPKYNPDVCIDGFNIFVLIFKNSYP